jgi:hypothetical protein
MDDAKDQRQDKPTLIIPAAGRSSRFPNMRPKWMLTHPSGRLMIQMVLDAIDRSSFGRIIVAILKEHSDSHDAEVILQQAFPQESGFGVETCVLDLPTKSSCETVFQTVQRLGVTGAIVVKDCDCLVDFRLPENPRFAVGLDIRRGSIREIRNLGQKSFIVSNDSQVIDEIVEKAIVSETICVGVYGMQTDEFLRSYQRMNGEIGSEMYMSHIISDLIDKDDLGFQLVDAVRYCDWGTKEAWFSSMLSQQTYLIDIDGVMLENTGRYGRRNWFNSTVGIRENIEAVKRLSDNGGEIIFITARPKDALQSFERLMDAEGIRFKVIIHSCLHSRRTVVNDFSNSNPYPTCVAINLPRNGSLVEYLP